MVTFLIIIGRVPAIMRFRVIFSSQKVIFIDLLKIKSLAIANPDFDENYIFDRFRSRRIYRVEFGGFSVGSSGLIRKQASR